MYDNSLYPRVGHTEVNKTVKLQFENNRILPVVVLISVPHSVERLYIINIISFKGRTKKKELKNLSPRARQ